jgi:hypothetical protein
MSKITIQWAFSKGLIDSMGRNKIPPHFSGYLRNARIVNQAICPRKWSVALDNDQAWPFRAMIRNYWELLAVSWGRFYKLLPTFFDYGPINGSTSITNRFSLISYANYTIIFNGSTAPYVYKKGSGTVFQVPTNNYPIDVNTNDPIGTFNPLIGAAMTWFTFAAGNTSADRHVLYVSQPIDIKSAEQEANCYNRWSTDLQGTYYNDKYSASRFMTSPILGMVATLYELFIFCEKTIEVYRRGEYINNGGPISYLYTQPLADGDHLASFKSAVAAGNKIFYLTSNLKVKTIWYEPGKEQPEIGDLSDRIGQEIRLFLEQNIDTNQSTCFGFFDRSEHTVEWHLKKKGTGINNITLLYDIINDTFLVDEWKEFGAMAFGGVNGDKVYAGSYIDWTYYEDDYDYYDQDLLNTTVPVPFEYNTPNIALWQVTLEKFFRGFSISWAMNRETTLTINCYVDGKLQFTKQVSRWDINPSELKAINIWGIDQPQDRYHPTPFEYVADQWKVRKKGKRIRIQIIAHRLYQNFYLDYLDIDGEATGNYELNDKF